MTKELYFILILIMLACLVLGGVAFFIGVKTKVEEKTNSFAEILSGSFTHSYIIVSQYKCAKDIIL